MVWLPFCGDGDVSMTTAILIYSTGSPPLGLWPRSWVGLTNEVGRQPWLVYNLMRTSEGVSPIPAGNVIWSLSLFLIIFIVVGKSYFYYVLRH